jgi:hypothetical protein
MPAERGVDHPKRLHSKGLALSAGVFSLSDFFRASSRLAAALVIFSGVLLGSGCARVRFESNPPGAVIEYSRTGAPPWLPLERDAETGEPSRTPLAESRPFHGYAFVRAQLEGYLPSVRRLVNFSDLWGQTIAFELEKTAAFAALEKLDAGFVFYEGEWVNPTERHLVQVDGVWMTAADADALAHLAAGEILFEGVWMPAEQARALERERLLAQGYVEYKGRLVPPERAKRLGAIDQQIAELAQRPEDLSATNASLETTGLVREGGSRLKAFNATSLQAEFLISGPGAAESLSVGPYEDASADLPAGEYAVAILPISPGVYPNHLGRAILLEGRAHTLTYLGQEFRQRDLDELLQGAQQNRLQVPEMDIPEAP